MKINSSPLCSLASRKTILSPTVETGELDSFDGETNSAKLLNTESQSPISTNSKLKTASPQKSFQTSQHTFSSHSSCQENKDVSLSPPNVQKSIEETPQTIDKRKKLSFFLLSFYTNQETSKEETKQ